MTTGGQAMGMEDAWMEEQEGRYDDGYDYWLHLKTYVPSEPAERYRHSLEQIDELTEDAESLNSYPAFHRMLLVQHVAMIEAYLADRLITLVTHFPDVAKKLVLGHQPLKGQTFSLEAAVGNPHLVTGKITTFLKNLMYHELELIAKLYRVSLGVEIFPDRETETVAKDAMVDRHHCVHRDGKDNLGNVLTAIDAAYVQKARTSFAAMFEHIERQCKPLVDRLPM